MMFADDIHRIDGILSLTSICRDIRIIKYTQFALFLLANILQIDKIILLLFNQKF